MMQPSTEGSARPRGAAVYSERWNSVNGAEVQWLTRGIPAVINHRTGQPQTCCSKVDRCGPLDFSMSLTLSLLLLTGFLLLITVCLTPLSVTLSYILLHNNGWNMLC